MGVAKVAVTAVASIPRPRVIDLRQQETPTASLASGKLPLPRKRAPDARDILSVCAIDKWIT